jgi:hypothetical protein
MVTMAPLNVAADRSLPTPTPPLRMGLASVKLINKRPSTETWIRLPLTLLSNCAKSHAAARAPPRRFAGSLTVVV